MSLLKYAVSHVSSPSFKNAFKILNKHPNKHTWFASKAKFMFQNVAMYGGLCALATFERSQLHKEVVISNTFKLFLELEPQLRDVIINFYESKYGKCLTQLEDMKDNMMLDIYLASHVNTLFSMIRSRSLVQYFRYEYSRFIFSNWRNQGRSRYLFHPETSQN